MSENKHKLIHTFGALAELGQEVANKNNFQETIRTSLHLILGSLGIMRGGVARYSRFGHEMSMLAVRGLGDDFPLSLSLCYEDERQFLTYSIQRGTSRFFYCQSDFRAGAPLPEWPIIRPLACAR